MNIKTFEYINVNDKKLCNSFISNHKNVKRYVLGCNKWADSILNYIEVDGIIDDFTDLKVYDNYPIVKMIDIPRNAIVISATMGSPKTAKVKLDNLGIKNIDYFAFYKYSKLKLSTPPPFISDFQDDFINNKEEYAKVYNLLNDMTSKIIFNNIINFKITLDLKFLNSFENNISKQYFEQSLYLRSFDMVFVDAGGYIGDTTAEFIKQFPSYKKIYFFEPIKSNMEIALSDLRNFKNIEFHNIGLSRRKDTLYFNEDSSSSAISPNGSLKIEVNSLDNIIKGRVDFIKFDIEGAEQDALVGAERLIRKYQPILAICIYHKAEDWHKIPKYVLSIHSNYSVYLRHYMEGIFETVIYFIPPNKVVK